MKILENVDNSKFESALSIAKKYGYRLHDVYNKPDDYVLWSPSSFGFTVSYGTKPAMIVPTITVSGIVSGEVDKVIQERDKLNTAIELAKELEKLYSAHTVEESVKLEGNNVSSEIPDKIDSFLQDVAQMTNIISYNDIIKFGNKLSQSEQYRKYALGGIEHLLDRWGEAALYEDELMMDDIAYDVKSYMTFPIKKTVTKESIKEHKESFRLNNVLFSVIFNGDKVSVKSLHPYDDAKYHYAISKDGGEQFSIYRDGKFVEQFAPPSFDEDEESGIKNFNWNEVARELLRLDKDVESRIDHT